MQSSPIPSAPEPGDDKASGLDDPFGHSLDYQLRRASLGTLQCLTQSLGELGVKVTEAAVIRVIKANAGTNQGSVAQLLGMQRANIVPVITGLVENGLVRREVADGRTNALYLTPEGEAMHARICATARAHEERFYGDMPEDMRAALIAAAAKIRARLDGE